MAKFQIYLMNLRSLENEFSPTYSLIPISDFKTQYRENDATKNIPIQMSDLILKEQNQENIDSYRDKRKYSTASFEQDNSFCYTYNEKFQIHQNTQRTLTFSMNQNFIRVDRIEKNPFINYLFIGAQLLLIDKYDNHHLMTVSKISYDFKSYNTVFNYECQDSFNYQLSRQNSGYEIENNAESTNFLGARSLDWWVLCKIHPECKISYQYLQLGQSNTEVKKPQYDYNTYPDFYRTIPFSASGTANSVLIALGELYGLQLKVYEKVSLNNGQCKKYYWFEPMKSLRPTGLKYSPHVDLQSFSLEHNSTSFSSILNIQTHTVGEEMITVLPSVPNFFRQWFETKEWGDSKFAHGLFTSACTESSDCIQYNQQSITDKSDLNGIAQSYRENEIFYYAQNGSVYIPIKPTSWSYKYDLLKFTTVGGTYSIFNIDGIKADLSNKTMGYNSKFTNWEVIYKLKDGVDENEETTDFEEERLYSTQTKLPINLIKKYGLDYCFLKLYFAPQCHSLVIDGKLYIAQYRIPSTEELEFAEIADQIPWLENKLIDFSYFYDHSIINASEHHQLMQLLENDLRKANAKLLLYSQLYYQAIQNKTKIIANLSAKIDKVGAVFQADLINPFMLDGRAKETTEFNLALSDLFANSSEPVKLITYYETLSDYVNKYFNAEQTFLKNMYLFRDYFESKSNLGTLYSYYFTLSRQNESASTTVITFNAPERYTKLTNSNQYNTIYEKQDEVYILYDKNEIINKDNYNNNNIYYLDPLSDNKKEINNNTPEYLGYNDEQVYYELQWEVKDNSLIDLIFKQESGKYSSIETFYFNNSEDKLFTCTLSNDYQTIHVACKNHCLHTTSKTPNWKYSNAEGNLQDVQNISHVYAKVSYAEMRANFFYQQLIKENQNNSLLRYVHRRDKSKEATLRSVSNWKNFHDLGLNGSLLEALSHNKNISDSDLKNLTVENSEAAETVYKQCFPISSYYWKGKAIDDKGQEAEQEDYHSVPFVNVENASQFYRRVSVSLEEYKNWQTGLSITGAAGLLGLIPFMPLGMLASVAVAPAIWGICQACWNNGEKTFNNTGWSFHDIFNCDVDSFQGWDTSDRLLYTKTATSYAKTHGKSIFPDNINGETWTETTSMINEEAWGYREATNLLLTYYSLSTRLTTALKEQYFYETSYYRILTKDDYIDKQDNFLMLWYSDNNITNLTTVPQDLKTNSTTKHLKRLDSVIYYPLKNHISSVSGSNYKWPENVNRMPLSNLLTNNQMTEYTLESDYIFKDKNSGAKVIYLKEERWTYDDLTDKEWKDVGYDNIYQIAASSLYDNDTFEQVNLITQYPQLTMGFYVTDTEESDYLPAKQLNSLDENKDYFKKVNNTYERRYTMNQLINKPNMYVQLFDTYYYQSFSEVDEIKVQYYIYKKTIKDNITSFDLVESALGILKKQNSQWQLVGETIAGETITKDCEVELYQEDLSNYTNGYFWYAYRNSTSSLLMEKTMLIETNLMEYWTNAYYASKNCKYFLPEYWQPTVDQQQNYFSSDIISPQNRDIETIETNISVKQPTQSNINLLAESISITNCTATSTSDAGWTTIQIETNDNIEFYQVEFNDIKYINSYGQQPIKSFIIDHTQIDEGVNITRPINTITSGTVQMTIQIQDSQSLTIKIPTTSFTNTDEYEAKLSINLTTIKIHESVYSTTSKPAEFLLSSIYIPQIKKVPNQWRYQFRHKAIMDSAEDIRATVNNLSIGDSVGLNTLISSVMPIQNAMNYLNINTLDWKAMRLQNDYVLYEHVSGGTLWTQMLDKLSGGALINNQFGGWYDMMIKILQTCNYENYNPVQYQQAQEEHDIIWRQVYTKYPNLCYEQSYTNKDATSSRELLQMAQWAFKDYTSPESNYSITVIDPNTLKGYKGQELKIGDGIEIDADELYDNFQSDIYQSLIQYLYITDINYDLRNDDNIQLTVNSIKYQDKVIGQLIKLIR